MVGDWVDKYPDSVKALSDAGHEVMNHSNTHPHFPQLSFDEILTELNACNDKIEAVTGVRPTLVRLPYGDYDDNSVSAVRSLNMEPIQWDVERSAIGSSHCSSMLLETLNQNSIDKVGRSHPSHFFYREQQGKPH